MVIGHLEIYLIDTPAYVPSVLDVPRSGGLAYFTPCHVRFWDGGSMHVF